MIPKKRLTAAMVHSPFRSWIGFGFEYVARLAMKITAPFVVPFLDEPDRVNHPIWGVDDATDLSWWNIGVRNACHNFRQRDSEPHECSGDLDMETAGLKRRACWSLDGKYRGYRVTWGKARPKKGKREFYIGWTLPQEKMRPVIQFRPF